MDIAERAQASLRNTESQLRQLLAEAAEAGEYATVVEIAALAKGVRDLLKQRGGVIRTPSETAQATQPSSRQKALASQDRNYPRFGRREDMLIRVSWSKAEKREYEQRASFSTLMRVVSLIADAGADDRVFATEDIVPAIDGAANEIPSYQVYVVVGLLRHAGLIEQHGRRGYSIPSVSEFKNATAKLWQSLPPSESRGVSPVHTHLKDHVDAETFISQAIKATTAADVEALLAQLPISADEDYSYDEESPERGWTENRFHWIPVGRDRGNAGRIKLANHAVNPIAERTVNGMEAIIELARQRELAASPTAQAPESPRAAVTRYFNVPSLDELPKLDKSDSSKAIRAAARDMARMLRVRLMFDKDQRAFTVAIEDDGIGQSPARVHKTLLSLGSTTKADKTYLIGVFGQGGSSAYAVSKYSWLLSRRAPDLLEGEEDGVAWTVIRHVFPKGRRDDYFAYLAASPQGHVPFVAPASADAVGVKNGTRFVHIGYDFGRGGSAITRQLYQSINHVLYNPVLPFELYSGPTAAPVYGNGYRLSSLHSSREKAPRLDKLFEPQPVAAKP